MKVLFLDIDGVLNISNKFSKASVKNLNLLLSSNPDLKIVISSSWRRKGLDFVKKVLSKEGIDSSKIIGATDLKDVDDRGHHIERYLEDHKEVTNFVIIDDVDDMDNVVDHLVQTNPLVGITTNDVKKAVDILAKKR